MTATRFMDKKIFLFLLLAFVRCKQDVLALTTFSTQRTAGIQSDSTSSVWRRRRATGGEGGRHWITTRRSTGRQMIPNPWLSFSSCRISSRSRSSLSALKGFPTNTSDVTSSSSVDDMFLDERWFIQTMEGQLKELQQDVNIVHPTTATTTTATSTKRVEPSLVPSSSLSSYYTPPIVTDQVPQQPSILQGSQKQEGIFGMSEICQARVLLLASAALYGTNFALVKLLGDTMPVGISSTLRFGMASFATMPWLLMNWNNNKEVSLNAALLGFEVGLWNSIGYVSQAVGLETTDASKSAFICSLAVVTVPLIDSCTGKRLLPREWLGIILAVLGVGMLELGGGGGLESTAFTTGDMCSLVQPLAFGVGFWKMEKLMEKHPTQASRSAAAQLLAVFMASAMYGLWSLDTATIVSCPWMEWITSPSLLFSLFWTGCITTGLTVYMETVALKTLSAAETTLIFSTEPLWGTAFAALVMGEQFGFDAAIGAVLILTGCLYSNLGMDGLKSLFGQQQQNNDDNKKYHHHDNSKSKTFSHSSGNIGTMGKQQQLLLSLPPSIQDLYQKHWLSLWSTLAATFAVWSNVTDPRFEESSLFSIMTIKDIIETIMTDNLGL